GRRTWTVTASRVDPRTVPMLRGRTAMLVASLTSVLLAACHAGLPPEPPGADPADPAAGAAPYQVQPNPYEISAFAGEPAPKADGHAGHGTMDHSSMGHGSTSEQTPATAAPTGHEQHMGHGSSTGGKQVPAPAPAAPTGHEHM